MTNSSPVVGNTTVTMMKLGSGTSSRTGYISNTGGTTVPYGSSINPYYPGWYPKTAGYTCPNCGTYVYGGYQHSCWPRPVYPTVIYQPVYIPQPPTDLTPLLEKLDDLTKEVKKLRKKLAE